MVPDNQAPSIPAVAPYYPRPPFLYRDCPFLVVTFRTTTSAIRRLVPEPLEPNADDLMVLLIGRQHNDRLGPYGQYHVCRIVLREQLGVEPSAETRSLYASLL